MTAALGALAPAVELLERSLAYTRVALSSVPADPRSWAAATSCSEWDLAALLAHMDDALDAFTEASVGVIAVGSVPTTDSTIASIQSKACGLLGAWSGQRVGVVRIADLAMPNQLVAATAALEITVHGWDVAQATGAAMPIPPDLAADLLPVAAAVIAADDRGRRFAPAVPIDDHAPAGHQLLAVTGRNPVGG